MIRHVDGGQAVKCAWSLVPVRWKAGISTHAAARRPPQISSKHKPTPIQCCQTSMPCLVLHDWSSFSAETWPGTHKVMPLHEFGPKRIRIGSTRRHHDHTWACGHQPDEDSSVETRDKYNEQKKSRAKINWMRKAIDFGEKPWQHSETGQNQVKSSLKHSMNEYFSQIAYSFVRLNHSELGVAGSIRPDEHWCSTHAKRAGNTSKSKHFGAKDENRVVERQNHQNNATKTA